MAGARVSFTAWEFDSKFHALIGSIQIWPIVSSSGEQVYRVPANATLIEPPQPLPPGNKRLIWIESTGHWVEVSDHRGEEWFDQMGRKTTIERLGNPEHWGMRRELRSQSGIGPESCSRCS